MNTCTWESKFSFLCNTCYFTNEYSSINLACHQSIIIYWMDKFKFWQNSAKFFKRSSFHFLSAKVANNFAFFRSYQDKEDRVAADRRGGGEIIRPDPNCARKSGPPGDESPFRGQDRPSPCRGIGFPEAVRQRQRGDEFLQQEQSAVNWMGGQRRWARLVVGQRRFKRATSGLLQKLQRSRNGCPFYGILGPGADHERNQLKLGSDEKYREMFERRGIGWWPYLASLVRLNDAI